MMKYYSLIIVLFISTIINGQNITMSSSRIGNIKLFSSVDSVNKFLATKISLRPFKEIYNNKYDTIYTTYNNISVRFIFSNYFDSEAKKQHIDLINIYSDDGQIKTKSGIKIGDNKFDIIKKLDGSYLDIFPDFDKRKNFSTVVLSDNDNGTKLTF